jgi:hypothetical protein
MSEAGRQADDGDAAAEAAAVMSAKWPWHEDGDDLAWATAVIAALGECGYRLVRDAPAKAAL